jgi:translation initiation factor IF-2
MHGNAATLTAIFWQEQVPIGSAEIRAVFSSRSSRVAGCMVTEGKVTKGCGIRVVRKGKVVHVGILDSLKRVKEIVKEVCMAVLLVLLPIFTIHIKGHLFNN